MDRIASLCTKVNEKFACKKCKYQSKRYGNLKRHIEESHLQIKVSCKCDKKMTKSALSRHRRLNCSISSKKSELTAASVVSIEKYTVSLNIQLTKLSDGSVSVQHDAINVDGRFSLVPYENGESNAVENRKLFGHLNSK